MRLSRSLLRAFAALGLSFLVLLTSAPAEAQAPAPRPNGSPVLTNRDSLSRAGVLASPVRPTPLTKSFTVLKSNRDWSTGRSIPLAKPWMRPLNL